MNPKLKEKLGSFLVKCSKSEVIDLIVFMMAKTGITTNEIRGAMLNYTDTQK